MAKKAPNKIQKLETEVNDIENEIIKNIDDKKKVAALEVKKRALLKQIGRPDTTEVVINIKSK